MIHLGLKVVFETSFVSPNLIEYILLLMVQLLYSNIKVALLQFFSFACLRFLGANIYAKSSIGKTALYYARRDRHSNIVRLLEAASDKSL